MGLVVGTLVAKAALDIDGGSFDKLDSAITNATTHLSQMSNETKLALSASIATVPAAIAAIAGAGLAVASNFEDASTTLTVLYGDIDTAKEKFQNLSAFAANTPFEFPELLDATVKLKAYGIEAADYLTILGDTSAAMGKSLNDTVEMLADAQTGEFERLKEYGVKAVEITKKNAESLGVSMAEAGKTALMYTDQYGQQQVKVIDRNNKESINAALVGVDGIFQKYTGAMEARSKTLAGLLSTLKDNVTMALADLVGFDMQTMTVQAGSLMGAIESLVKAGIGLTNWLSNISETTQTFIVAAGAGIAIIAGLTSGFILLGVATSAVAAAELALGVGLSTVLLPVTAIVAGVALLAAGLYYLNEKTGLVTYSWNLLKDIFTIVSSEILRAASILKSGVGEVVDWIKEKISSLIPANLVTSVTGAIDGIVGQFERLGINIHAKAETIRGDGQTVETAATGMGTAMSNSAIGMQGSGTLMGSVFNMVGYDANSMQSAVTNSGTQMQGSFIQTGSSATGMGSAVTNSGTQMQGSFIQTGSTATGMSSLVTSAGAGMVTSMNSVGAASTDMSGTVSSAKSGVEALTYSVQIATNANGSYAASFKDISSMASDAASAAVSASSKIGAALKTSAGQVGNVAALAGKWNTTAKLGKTSRGGSGTGESNVKVISAKTTTTTTNNTSNTININTTKSSSNVVSDAKRSVGK
ncbi:MAG: hypothetical protein WC248_00925 [Candidatus Methanomethylophilaceae archaeon]|jgi:hypothetical protein